MSDGRRVKRSDGRPYLFKQGLLDQSDGRGLIQECSESQFAVKLVEEEDREEACVPMTSRVVVTLRLLPDLHSVASFHHNLHIIAVRVGKPLANNIINFRNKRSVKRSLWGGGWIPGTTRPLQRLGWYCRRFMQVSGGPVTPPTLLRVQLMDSER